MEQFRCWNDGMREFVAERLRVPGGDEGKRRASPGGWSRAATKAPRGRREAAERGIAGNAGRQNDEKAE